MDSFDLLGAFQQVAALGNFSRAARNLGMSKGTVSRYVAELESRFGVRLLNRSTRSVSLTDAGAFLLERSVPVIDMLRLARDELHEHARRPTGRLRLSAPHGMSQGGFPKLLTRFLARHPDVRISLHLTNCQVDMAEEAIDVALLLGPHPHWRFEEGGKSIDVAVSSRLDASEGGPLIEAAMQGFGVLYLPAMLVQAQLEQGELVAVLQDFARTDVWLSAAYLRRQHNSAALRALLEFSKENSVRLRSGLAATGIGLRSSGKSRAVYWGHRGARDCPGYLVLRGGARAG